MKIVPLASSSAGNAYVVTDGRHPLLLECGLPIDVLTAALRKQAGIDLGDLSGCLLTHEHQDHARSAGRLMERGVDIHATIGTLRALGLGGVGHPRALAINKGLTYYVSGWRFRPFHVEHDATDPVGFFIGRPHGTERLVYLTDTGYSPVRFARVTHLMIGCNYSEELLDQAVKRGSCDRELRRRIRRAHMSLERVLAFLEANDLTALQEIHLLHLSDAHSDEKEFRRAVQAATGKRVYVAPR